jgi:hypothetical protein
LQDVFDGEAGKAVSVFGFDAPPHQLRIGVCQGIGFNINIVDHFHNIRFVRDQLQLAGFFRPAVDGHAPDALRCVAGWRRSAEPAPGLGKLVHIVPNAFRNRLAFQLGKNRSDIHHGPAHRRAGVKLLADGNKADPQLAELLNQPRKIADVAADPIQAVDHNGFEFVLSGSLHHFLEAGSVQISAGKALVLVNDHIFGIGVAAVDADIFPAQFHLIADALAFAREFRFA